MKTDDAIREKLPFGGLGLLFGHHATDQANEFAAGMVGAVKMVEADESTTVLTEQLILALGKSRPIGSEPTASLTRFSQLSPHAE